ncbi:MAG: hypothetical protein ACKOCK_03365, partial [Chloroflexota bacterium]
MSMINALTHAASQSSDESSSARPDECQLNAITSSRTRLRPPTDPIRIAGDYMTSASGDGMDSMEHIAGLKM